MAAYDQGPMDSVALDIGCLRISLSKEFRRQDHATRGKPGWMQSRMIQGWRILEPRNLILLFPIRDAAPMSAAGFARVAIEAAILNYIIGHADPFVTSNPAAARYTR
jgi:hypothetical protein